MKFKDYLKVDTSNIFGVERFTESAVKFNSVTPIKSRPHSSQRVKHFDLSQSGGEKIFAVFGSTGIPDTRINPNTVNPLSGLIELTRNLTNISLNSYFSFLSFLKLNNLKQFLDRKINQLVSLVNYRENNFFQGLKATYLILYSGNVNDNHWGVRLTINDTNKYIKIGRY